MDKRIGEKLKKNAPGTYKVLKYPERALIKKTKPLKEITTETLSVISCMKETLRKASGIGLAANQVGIPLRIMVMSVPSGEGEREEIALINPEITEKFGKIYEDEGCLSFPGLYLRIKRSKSVKVNAVNEKGNKFIIEGDDFVARILQHEIDHLNGKTFLDRLPLFKRLSVKREIRRKIKKGEW
jgi:peptide deformylase